MGTFNLKTKLQMKFAALAALLATVNAQDDAAAKVCADPAVKVTGYAKADCSGDATKADDAGVKAVLAINDLIKAGNGKCAKVEGDQAKVWTDAKSYKVTCTDTKISWAYFSDDACATAKADATGKYGDIAAAACATKDWAGAALAAPAPLGMKVELAATVASGASHYGMALAATTLAVAASLY